MNSAFAEIFSKCTWQHFACAFTPYLYFLQSTNDVATSIPRSFWTTVRHSCCYERNIVLQIFSFFKSFVGAYVFNKFVFGCVHIFVSQTQFAAPGWVMCVRGRRVCAARAYAGCLLLCVLVSVYSGLSGRRRY